MGRKFNWPGFVGSIVYWDSADGTMFPELARDGIQLTVEPCDEDSYSMASSGVTDGERIASDAANIFTRIILSLDEAQAEAQGPTKP